MNIAILTSSYLPVLGGLQFELYWLLRAIDSKFRERGIGRFIFILPKYEKQEFTDFNNIEVVELDRPINTGLGKLSLVMELKRLSKEYRIDLINCFSALPEGICCLASSLVGGAPYIITSQGVDLAVDRRFDYGNRLKPLSAFLTSLAIRNARCVTTLSRDMAAFAEDAGARKENIRIIPNGIELELPAPEGEIEQKIRQRYSISDSHTVYLTLSGMRKIKGHENLVKAFALALKKNGRLLLFIGAHGHETERIKALVKELGIDGSVHFIGFVTGPEKTAWFNIADVYCNTAFFEPFGIVYIEAVLHRLAVLGTTGGGARDIFRHKDDAYLIDPESVEDIAGGILALADAGYRGRMVEKAVLLLPLYDINMIADMYLDTYLEHVRK